MSLVLSHVYGICIHPFDSEMSGTSFELVSDEFKFDFYSELIPFSAKNITLVLFTKSEAVISLVYSMNFQTNGGGLVREGTLPPFKLRESVIYYESHVQYEYPYFHLGNIKRIFKQMHGIYYKFFGH